jgi:hypothetical protein
MLTITCGKEDVVYGCNDTFVVLSGNITTFTIPEQKTIPEQVKVTTIYKVNLHKMFKVH